MISKPLIGLDWHDVLSDYTTPFLDWYYQNSGHYVNRESIWGSFEQMGFDSKWFQEFEETEEFNQMPYLDGACWALEQLREKYKIAIVSSCNKILQNRWVREFPEASMYLYTTNKSYVVNQHRMIAFVDDQVRKLEGIYRNPICFAQPWNAGYTGLRLDWQSIVEYLLAMPV